MKPEARTELIRLGFPEHLLAPELPHHDALVKRCALVSGFDRRLHQAAMSVGLENAPGFDDFVQIPEIEQSVSLPEVFWVRDSVRLEALYDWRSRPEEWKAIAGDIARRLPKDDRFELDRISLLLTSDPVKGRFEFEEMFEKANAADDLPKCGALIHLLEMRISEKLLDEETVQVWRGCRAKYGARSLFLTEFHQTSHYLHRRDIEEELLSFVRSGGEEWILDIHGAGGMGKTTLLRWLVARNLVREEPRVPVVWLDFDHLDVLNVVHAPWLLALPLGAQLDEQTEHKTFATLLSSSTLRYAPLLFRGSAPSGAAEVEAPDLNQASVGQYRAYQSNAMRCGPLLSFSRLKDDSERNALLEEAKGQAALWTRFAEALASLPAGGPVAVVIDTVEEASLHHSASLLGIIRSFKRMRAELRKRAQRKASAPSDLRLILSGRYSLGKDHVPEFAREFEDEFSYLELRLFTREEAEDFLVRKLPVERHSLIPRLVDKSKRLPFQLELLASWAIEDPELNHEKLEASTEFDIVWLIERVIKRIPDQALRWMVRYGVVPRRLSFEFVRDVMCGPLEKALSGAAQAEGLDRADSVPERSAWAPAPGVHIDPHRLWTEGLIPYASEQSWIIPEPSDTSLLRFRPEVVKPMRALLRDQAVFVDLHRRALEHYRTKAAEEPQRWGEWTVEGLYHLSQFAGESISSEMRGVFEEERIRRDPQLRLYLAESLLTDDFSSLSASDRSYIEYHAAEAMAAAAGYVYSRRASSRASSVALHLGRAIELAGHSNEGGLPVFAFDWWESFRKPLDLSKTMERLSALPPEDAIRLAVLAADEGGPRTEVTWQYLEEAARLARSLTLPPVPLAVLEERMGAWAQANGRLEECRLLFERAAEHYSNDGAAEKSREMERRAAEVLMELGEWQRASGLLQRLSNAGQRDPDLLLRLARLELSAGQPGRALVTWTIRC